MTPIETDSLPSASSSSTFRATKTKGLSRPGTTWFGPLSRSAGSTSGSSSSSLHNSTSSTASCSSDTHQDIRQQQQSFQTLGAQREGGGGRGIRTVPIMDSYAKNNPNPFSAPGPAPNFPPPSSFKSPFPSSKGKHKLSPSPSPSTRHNSNDEDFVMISPLKQTSAMLLLHTRSSPRSPLASKDGNVDGRSQREPVSAGSSSMEESPTPAYSMANAAAKLKLVDEESPIKRVPGHSRSLQPGLAGKLGRGEGTARNIFDSVQRGPSQKLSTSPLKFATNHLEALAKAQGGDDEEDELLDLPPTPLLPNGPDLPAQPLFTVPALPRSSQGLSGQSHNHNLLFGPSSSGLPDTKLTRLSTSQPIRPRAGTSLDMERPILGGKKTNSLNQIPVDEDQDEPLFGMPKSIGTSNNTKKLRQNNQASSSSLASSSSSSLHRAHKRINSGDQMLNASNGSISRSVGQKYGLALTLSPNTRLPDFSNSNSSLSSLSTNHLTPPASAFSPTHPPLFDSIKPSQEAFDNITAGTVSRKYVPRDSGVDMSTDEGLKPSSAAAVCPPSTMKMRPRPSRPPMLKRTSSMGDHRQEIETPGIGPAMDGQWPSHSGPFAFLGEAADQLGLGLNVNREEKPVMPGTPTKTKSYKTRIGHSSSQPTLASDSFDIPATRKTTTSNIIAPPTAKKPSAALIPHLTLTGTSSPDPESPNSMDTDNSSPTVRLGQGQSTVTLDLSPGPLAPPSRVGMLRRQSSGDGSSDGSESEGTPTKGTGAKTSLAPPKQFHPSMTLTPNPKSQGIPPRLSLPSLPAPRQQRPLAHRQSHPATNGRADVDIFESKFIVLGELGKGAFSTVLKVQERDGEGIFAVKKARGMFDGVRDRLRHLEEVDILRHLSKTPCPHIIRFEDAWEQNRQLYIQTELALGSLAFFLEEYGRVIERLDEARVWKCIRELGDGLNHIHSHGVIHFDIKPANILINDVGQLKIADFGHASRWPRVSPSEIIRGSGLGGNTAMLGKQEKLEREGDRVYMAPEMLRGVFVMAADIFSFGLVLLELSLNICMPDGGQLWHALREGQFDVMDLSVITPALTDLITSCMSPDPQLRPTIQHIVAHPIVQRARTDRAALAPEKDGWLVDVIAGGDFSRGSSRLGQSSDTDVIMADS